MALKLVALLDFSTCLSTSPARTTGDRLDPVARRVGLRLLAARRGERPGTVPRALRPGLADLRAPGAARAAGRRGRDAARPRRAPGPGRRPGDRRGAGQGHPRAPAGRAGLAGRGRLAGPRRRDPLLRHGRCDVLVPRPAGRDRRRRAAAPSWSPRRPPPRRWLERSLERGHGLVRYGPRTRPGGLHQQGWRDATDPEHHPGGGGILRADGTEPTAPLADADVQAVAVAALSALAVLDQDRAAHWQARATALRAEVTAAFTPDVMAIEADGRPVPGAGSQLGWLLWADALEPDGGRPGGGAARRQRRTDGLRAAHPLRGAPGVPGSRIPPRCGLAVRQLAGLGRPGRPAVHTAHRDGRAGPQRGPGRARATGPRTGALRRHAEPASSSRSRSPTACRPGRSGPLTPCAPAGRVGPIGPASYSHARERTDHRRGPPRLAHPAGRPSRSAVVRHGVRRAQHLRSPDDGGASPHHRPRVGRARHGDHLAPAVPRRRPRRHRRPAPVSRSHGCRGRTSSASKSSPAQRFSRVRPPPTRSASSAMTARTSMCRPRCCSPRSRPTSDQACGAAGPDRPRDRRLPGPLASVDSRQDL